MIETKNEKSLGEISRGNAVEHPDRRAGDGGIVFAPTCVMRALMKVGK